MYPYYFIVGEQKVNYIVITTMRIFLITSLIFFGAPVAFVFAEENPDIYFDAPKGAIAPQSEFILRMLLKSEKPVNAASFTLTYSHDIFELLNIHTKSSVIDSVIDFWVEGPRESRPGVVSGQGGASVPFAGEDGLLLELDFRARAVGVAQVSLLDTQLYYADGGGTRAPVKKKVLFFDVSPDGEVLGIERREDTTPPVFQEFHIATNPIDGLRMIVFKGADSESGVQKIYIRTRAYLSWSEWQEVSIPTRLDRGVWAVEFMLVDSSGNETTKTRYIFGEIIQKIIYIGFFFLLIALIFMGINRFKKRVIS